MEDQDYYSSDEDTFLDRTGSVEKKRDKRMKIAGKVEEKAETYESLVRFSKKLIDIHYTYKFEFIILIQ